MEDVPDAGRFERHVGETLRLDDGTPLTLVAVDRARGGRPQGRGYTLILRGAAHPVIAEGMHGLSLGEAGAYRLYMSPIHTPGTTHQDYQIVFN